MNIKEEFDKLLKMHSEPYIVETQSKPNKITPEIDSKCLYKKEILLFENYKEIIEHLYDLHSKNNSEIHSDIKK